jgi:hypothetical protein
MRAMNPIAQAAQTLAAKTFTLKPADVGTGATRFAAQAQLPNAGVKGLSAPARLSSGDALLTQAALLKRRLSRKALLGAASSLIPLPLIDLAVDVALLSSMLNEVHTAFGLSPAQQAALDAGQKHKLFAAIQWVGNRAIGQLVTAALVKRMVAGMGLKLTAGQLSKAVPVAGQLASAAINYATLRHIVNQHIDDCVKVLIAAQSNAHG